MISKITVSNLFIGDIFIFFPLWFISRIWHRISWKEIQTFYSQHLLTLLIMGQFGVSFIYADIRTKLYTISPNGYNRNRYLTDSPMFYLKLASPSRVSYPIKGSQISSKNFFTRKNSNLYKLPLKFVSNAKPVDIIQGKGFIFEKSSFLNIT